MFNLDRSTRMLAFVLAVGASAAMSVAVYAIADDTPAVPPTAQDTAPAPAPAAVPAPVPVTDPAPTAQAAPQPAPPPESTVTPASVPGSTLVPSPKPAPSRTSTKGPVSNAAKTAAPAAVGIAPAEATVAPATDPVAATPSGTAESAAATPASAAQEPVATAPATLGGDEGGMLKTAGNFVLPGVLLALVMMAIASWVIMRNKRSQQDQLLRQAEQAQTIFWTSGSVRQGARNLEDGSPFRDIAETALRAAEHQQSGRALRINRYTWTISVIQHTAENVQRHLQSGIDALAILASLAVVVGLLGAVWEIFQGMASTGAAGPASIGELAAPLGVALVLMALALAVAIPAVLGRERLDHRNSACMAQVRSFCTELRKTLRGDSDTYAQMPALAAGAR
jgi:biopolymer transport protein ExbB